MNKTEAHNIAEEALDAKDRTENVAAYAAYDKVLEASRALIKSAAESGEFQVDLPIVYLLGNPDPEVAKKMRSMVNEAIEKDGFETIYPIHNIVIRVKW